jgi:hypothetical protein
MAHAELWKKRVEDWRASGLSAAEYCKGQEFTTGTLYRWSSRLAEPERSKEGSALPLVRPDGPRWSARDCGAPGSAHSRCEPGSGARANPGRVVVVFFGRCI